MLRAAVRIGVLPTIFLLASVAGATPYWYKWDGTDWPENQPGWYRIWGNYDGAGQGHSNRSLVDGTLVFDNLHDVGLYDGVARNFSGTMNPEPGEVFVAKWRIRIDAVVGGEYDSTVGLFSDDGWGIGIRMAFDRLMRGPGHSLLITTYEPQVFHAVEFRSWDMREAQLWLDGTLVFTGPLAHPTTSGYVAWGDSVMGAGSRAAWDYFEMGVRSEVPEPHPIALLVVAGGVRARRTR